MGLKPLDEGNVMAGCGISVTVSVKESKACLLARTALDVQVNAGWRINRGGSSECKAYSPIQNCVTKRPGLGTSTEEQVPKSVGLRT